MNPSIANQPVYQADPTIMQSIQHCRERVHSICKHHMHKCVRIHTMSGELHEGTIVGFDDHFLYLDISLNANSMRQYYPTPIYPTPVVPYNPYYSTVLPLVLYNLLAISLL
jgi:hypothetical protein